MPKMVHFVILKLAVKKVLPDRSIVIRQKLVENAKMENSNETFWIIFKHCVTFEKIRAKRAT